jgi:IS30 family transposase
MAAFREGATDPDDVRELLDQGVSVREIAARLGRTERTIQRIKTEKLKLSSPAPKPFTPEEFAIAERMLDDGVSYSEVARTLGRSSITALQNRFPNRGWSREETSDFASVQMKFRHARARLDLVMV